LAPGQNGLDHRRRRSRRHSHRLLDVDQLPQGSCITIGASSAPPLPIRLPEPRAKKGHRQ
jgi:7,8-dihydro-6-hydroxymethylpterin-pyrophosphokinase